MLIISENSSCKLQLKAELSHVFCRLIVVLIILCAMCFLINANKSL